MKPFILTTLTIVALCAPVHSAAASTSDAPRVFRVIESRHNTDLPNSHPCKRDIGSYGDPTMCLVRGKGKWHHVHADLAAALKDSGFSDHAQRRCYVNWGPTTYVACIGGRVISS